MAFILGVGSCMYAFLATDAATHIAEVRIKYFLSRPNIPETGEKTESQIPFFVLKDSSYILTYTRNSPTHPATSPAP